MNFDKLDRILLSHSDVEKIMVWDNENHHKFDSVDFPMTEGLLLVKGYFDFLKREMTNAIYFNVTADAIKFKLYQWDSKTELISFDLDENFYKHQKLSNVKIYVKGATEQDVYRDFKSQCLLLFATFQYMNHHRKIVKEDKVFKNVIKKARHKSSKSKNRVVKLTAIQYTFDYEQNNNPRPYERHAESWRVRGHWRHYKSGKSVWIEPYTKGKGEIEPKTYKV